MLYLRQLVQQHGFAANPFTVGLAGFSEQLWSAFGAQLPFEGKNLSPLLQGVLQMQPAAEQGHGETSHNHMGYITARSSDTYLHRFSPSESFKLHR